MKTEYDVISSDNVNELIGDVEKFLAKGWKCQGGVSVTVTPLSDGFIRFFHQAITREVVEGAKNIKLLQSEIIVHESDFSRQN